MDSKLLKEVQPVLNMFVVGRTFKISELFDPIVWEGNTTSENEKIAKEFKESLNNELKGIVEIKDDSSSDLFIVYKKIGNEKLMQIALQMPINSWLGAYNQTRINRAKELGIYENKFISQVKSKDIINDGFKGKEIATDIARRQKDEIKKYLLNFVNS